MRSAGSWVEGRDPASLAGRLDKGEIVWRAFVDAGTAMRRHARYAEADRMLERGLGAFADDPTLLYEHALCAHDSGRYALAVARWERALRLVARMSPDRAAMCRSGLAANLRASDDLARARAVIAEARRLHPTDLVVLSEAARIAEAGGELEEALALWRTTLASAEPAIEWMQGEIAVLVRLGRLDEAAAALELAKRRLPQVEGLMGAEGLLASARGEWGRAIEIWTAYLALHPDDRGGRDQLAAATAAHAAAPAAATPAPPAPLAAGELLRAFESIGDSCEFAVVQRRCGVDAGGLLAWSTSTFDALLHALHQRLAGIGEAGHSRLIVRPDGERVVHDDRWPIDMLAPDDGEPGRSGEEANLAAACRRLTLSRERLLADLASAEKVFVFRSDSLDGDRLELLHRALAAYGPVRLLSVQPAAPTAPTLLQGRAGDVIRVEANRFVGFLERFAGSGGPPAVDDWVALCRKAADMAKA